MRKLAHYTFIILAIITLLVTLVTMFKTPTETTRTMFVLGSVEWMAFAILAILTDTKI